MSIYITNDERFLLSHIDGEKFDIQHRQAIFDDATPAIISNFIDQYGAEESLTRLTRIAVHIEKRRSHSRSRLKKYELACFAGWVRNIKDQIERQYDKASGDRAISFVGAVMAIIRRRQGGSASH